MREKMVVFGKIGCIRAKWLYSSKEILFGQSCCIWAKVVVFGQIGCILAKLVRFLHIACRWSELVVIGQLGCFRAW